MKTITLQDETWKEINLIKYALGCDTIDDVINKLILNYQTQKANGEPHGEN